MNLRKMPLKKSAKFLTLLLTSIVIASVSAGMYLSLTMTSTVQVYKSNVYFVKGSDNGTDSVVLTLDSTNTTATITGLRAYPNATFTYENVTLVRNNATTGETQIRLAPDVNPSAHPEDFEYVNFALNGTGAGNQGWLNYTSSGSAWSNTGASDWATIGTSTEWPIAIITMATSGADVGDSVTITIKVDVD